MKSPQDATRETESEEHRTPPCLRPVEMWPINRPKPHPDNPRLHSREQLERLAKSLETFKPLRPIIVDEQDLILAGHGIWQAHGLLRRQEIAVLVVDHLTEVQKRGFLVADNQLALASDWDQVKLSALIAQLEKELEDVNVLGFDPHVLDRLLADLPAEMGFVPDDELPPPPPRPVTVPGDLWILGRHRLLCGDSTRAETFSKLLAGRAANMVFGDSPYNVAYQQKCQRQPRNGATIANDDLGEQFEQFLYSVCVPVLAVCEGAVYLCMSSSELHTLYNAFTAAGGYWSTFIIWSKDRFTLGRSNYQRQYEVMLYGWRKGQKHYWNGGRNQGDVWCVPKPKANRLHPTVKPVSLIERAIRNSSRRGDVVLDPFGGSGSTLIACEKTGRHAALVELEPKYVDVTVQRWEAYTRQQAHLEADGRSYAEVAAQRREQVA